MVRPILSIGMIVKNEERCLEKCLKALKPLRDAIPCELVIADTGSTDKTREIAKKYADIFFDFEWVNDFAIARNAVMDKCTGEWYLTVDADEYLNPSIDEIVSFLTGPPAKKYKHATVVIRNFNTPDMLGEYLDFNALRMVRMDTGKRYKGSIHEAFPSIEMPLLIILKDTIFDHDGYTQLSPKHLKAKSKRNMELIEKELKENPKSIPRVLQCLESVGGNIEKKRYYTDYAHKLLINAKKDDLDLLRCGGACAKEILKVMIADRHPETVNFLNWTLKNMPDAYHVLLDVRYTYIKFLYSEEIYDECAKFCKDYLESFERYQNRDKSPSITDLGRPIAYAQQKHKREIETLLANVLFETEKYDEAMNLLNNIDLTDSDQVSSNNWFSAILHAKSSEKLKVIVGKTIGELLQKYHNNELKTNEPYELAISTISKPFSCHEKKSQDHNIFELVPGAIGLSVKIANSKTKEEAESYLNQIKIWEEFMPLALGKVIELNAKLPDKFFSINPTRLIYLTNDLIRNISKYSQRLIENYFNIDFLLNFPRVSFSHNLLLSVFWGKKFNQLSYLEKERFLSAFYNIAKKYLNTCYNELILSNEELIICLPTTTLFSWYLVKANSLKDSNPLEYVKTLRTALKKVPQAKDVIEFLIEEFKNEEELKRQEKIKNTSPELLQMAEQLKTMLAALPPNSPELLAIKQSPMYKQVAFLIED